MPRTRTQQQGGSLNAPLQRAAPDRRLHLRRAARKSLTHLAAISGILARLETQMRGGWTILTYHRILEDPLRSPFPSLVTPLDSFREQVRWLAHRCRILTVADALAEQRAAAAPPDDRPLVSLTFDDGYVDGYSLAAEVLESHRLRATYFITTGPIGTLHRLWFDAAARRFLAAPPAQIAAALAAAGRQRSGRVTLKGWMRTLKSLEPAARDQLIHALPPAPDEQASGHDRLLRPEELADLAGRGHEIASHTVTHPMLPRLDDAALHAELAASRDQLAAWVGLAPIGFCYPNGDHDARAVAAVRAAGYQYACTTIPGRNARDADPLALNRIDVNPARVMRRDGRHDPLAFRAQVCLLNDAMT